MINQFLKSLPNELITNKIGEHNIQTNAFDLFKYSDVESRRFGKIIYRGHPGVYDLSVLRQFFNYNNPDILIIRFPAEEQCNLHSLNSLDKDIIHADTLVYYQLDLKKTFYNPVKNVDLVFRQATDHQRKDFEGLVPRIFNNYANHYFSNPLLDNQRIKDGYTEWVTEGLSKPDHFQVLAYDGGIAIAFITYRISQSHAEIVMNGVLPEYEGRGIYTDLLRYVKQYCNELNIPAIRVSTQIQNYFVQKVWNKEGLILDKAFVTIHLNKR